MNNKKSNMGLKGNNLIMRSIFAAHILLTAIILSASCGTVFAEEIVYPSGTRFEISEIDMSSDEDNGETVKLMADTNFEDYIVDACMSHTEKIDVKSFKMQSEELFKQYCEVALKHPELMVMTRISYSKAFLTSNVTYIQPGYMTSSAAEDEAARRLMADAVNDYISRAAYCKTDLEKILVIHDELIKDCHYDLDYNDNAYHAYGIFADKTAVCQGYSQAFYMICGELGIQADFCESEDINHIWNYVCLDGKWYQIDLTWDDPVIKNSSGQVVERTTAYHDNFLVTDAEIAKEHGSKATWSSYVGYMPDCSNGGYQSDYIFNIPKPFTISYDGKVFSVPYSLPDKSVLQFTSASLYTGPFVTAEPVVGKKSVTQYFYCFSKPSEELTVFTGVKDASGKTIQIKKSNRNYLEGQNLYKEIYIKPEGTPTDAEISFYFWRSGTLVPFTSKSTAGNL